ncbi:MAG: glycosyltransferase 87 family protein [Candidatus Helarchaeota archaeon]
MKSLKDLLEPHSYKRIFFVGVIIYVVIYIIIFIITNVFFMIDATIRPGFMRNMFFDFYYFYQQQGWAITHGLIPNLHYIPLYPIVAEYYMALFTLFGQNPHMARIFQLLLVLSTLWVGLDIIKLIKLENPKVHFFLLIISLPFVVFAIYEINYDILVVFFMILAIDFFLRKNFVVTGIFLGLGFGTKLFPIILAIPIMIHLIKNKKLKELILFLLSCIGTIAALYMPFAILATIQQGTGIFGVISNFIDFILAPMSYFDDKPLNLPFYFFQIFGVDKFFLKVVQALLAFGLVLVFSVYHVWKHQEADVPFLFSALIIFFFFQPYIMPWYFIWITVIYHLIYKEKPEVEYAIHQPLLIGNCLVYAVEGFFLKYFLLYQIMSNDDWNYAYMLPNGFILPAIVIGFITAYMQVLVLIFLTTNKWKYQKILIGINIALIIVTVILLPIAIFIHNI